MAAELKELLTKYLQAKSGFDAFSLFDSDDLYQFSGAYELVGHLTNSFGRRDWCQAASSPYLALMFDAVNQSGILRDKKGSKSIS